MNEMFVPMSLQMNKMSVPLPMQLKKMSVPLALQMKKMFVPLSLQMNEMSMLLCLKRTGSVHVTGDSQTAKFLSMEVYYMYVSSSLYTKKATVPRTPVSIMTHTV